MSGSDELKVSGSDRDKAREDSRVSMFLSAKIVFDVGKPPVEARVRNLSAGGIMIESAQVFPAGHPVTCGIKNVGDVSGHVAWASGGRMGIRFDNDINPDAARVTPKKVDEDSVWKPVVVPTRRPGIKLK